MVKFTYEADRQADVKYETYEWDSTWIEHANDTEVPRILYIGDSISCATRHIATANSGNKIFFDGFGTSKGLDNPFFKESINVYVAQSPSKDAVIFNNGLHGWHLADDGDYAAFYEDMVKFLLDKFKDVPIAIVLTTDVESAETSKRVTARNEEALKIAEKYSLPVIDLHSVSVANKNLLSEDGVHFTHEGYVSLADEILKRLPEISKKFTV